MQVQPYAAGSYGSFRDVLPPGTNGRASLVELAAFLATGARPPHNDDQRDMYARLLSATPGVSAATLPSLFKDASFAIAPGDQRRAYSPMPGLTITRDSAFGVPHVYGTTRAAAMFGLGYVAAEDRLFLMDALRHAGRGRLSSFAGGAAGNRRQDASNGRSRPTPRPTCNARPTSSTTSTAPMAVACRRMPPATSPVSTSTSPRPGSTSRRCPASTTRSRDPAAPIRGR